MASLEYVLGESRAWLLWRLHPASFLWRSSVINVACSSALIQDLAPTNFVCSTSVVYILLAELYLRSTQARAARDLFARRLTVSGMSSSLSPCTRTNNRQPQPEQAYASPAQNPTNGRAPAESGRTSVSQPGTPDSANKSSVNGTPANSSSTTQLPAVESWAPKENAPGENGSSTPGTKKRPREEDEETSRREGDVGDVEKRAREV